MLIYLLKPILQIEYASIYNAHFWNIGNLRQSILKDPIDGY
jgi:hypothetical protein